MRTRLTLILTSSWWPIRLHAIPVKGFLEICEDMVQVLLALEVLFTQDSEIEICSQVLLSALN